MIANNQNSDTPLSVKTEVLKPRDAGLRSSLTWSATGTLMAFLEHALGIRLTTQGMDNLTSHPTLYVVNHFTRAETFIVPYLLYKIRREIARTLAHHSLFVGPIGRFISRLGAVSTREEQRDAMIIGDLMTGRKNWVIYPEGLMVKNKKFMDHGKFMISSPEYEGPPRTGAATLALRAELYKRDYLDACERADDAKKGFYEQRYRFSGPDQISKRELLVTPVNITYYPIRPQENKASQLARTLFKDLPARLSEELQVEGRILLGKTDMNVYFCPPVSLQDYLKPKGFVPRLIARLQGPESVITQTLASQKGPLTTVFMGAIYRNLDVNFDHLFCYGLLVSRHSHLIKADFHNALLLTALELERLGLCRLRKSLAKECARIAFGLEHAPLESIAGECQREGLLEDDGAVYLTHRDRFAHTSSFHDIRLRLTAKVIANEFEPLDECVKRLSRNVNLSAEAIKERLSAELASNETRHYKREYARYFSTTLSKSPDVGEPFDLPPSHAKPRAGVLLLHGYLAAPMEMRYVGESLRQQGYHVYGARLDGHGTSPRNLVEVTWQDWLLSATTGYALLRNRNPKVYVVGFSMGGLIALLKAAELGDQAAGIVLINPALRVKDNRMGLAGAVVVWNEILQNLSIESGRFEYVENHPQNPDINYARNYVRGVRQLALLMEEAERRLPEITCPTYVIQSREDPVVKKEGAELIHKRIASTLNELAFIDATSHVVVTNEHRDCVASLVGCFLNRLESTSAFPESPLQPSDSANDKIRLPETIRQPEIQPGLTA